MSIGPYVRYFFGPLEKFVSDLYRSFFINLDELADQIQEWSNASNILELGCGEGAVTELLAKRFPNAFITGLDITPKIGRLFNGNRNRVVFRQDSIQNFSIDHIEKYDLLVICDVMHHIPLELHKDFLINARKTLKPGGYFVLKDWKRSKSIIHFMCYLSDRYITGDRVSYNSRKELQASIFEVFGKDSIEYETCIKPWKNNIAFLVRKVNSPEIGSSQK